MSSSSSAASPVAVRASPACRPSAPTCSTRRTRSSAIPSLSSSSSSSAAYHPLPLCSPTTSLCPHPLDVLVLVRRVSRRCAGKPGVQTVGTNVLDQTHAKLRHPLAVLVLVLVRRVSPPPVVFPHHVALPPSPRCPRPRPPRLPPCRCAGKPGVQTVGTNVLDQTHAKLRHPLAVLVLVLVRRVSPPPVVFPHHVALPPSPRCPRPRPPRLPPCRCAGKPGVQTVGTNMLDQTHAKLRHPLAVLVLVLVRRVSPPPVVFPHHVALPPSPRCPRPRPPRLPPCRCAGKPGVQTVGTNVLDQTHAKLRTDSTALPTRTRPEALSNSNSVPITAASSEGDPSPRPRRGRANLSATTVSSSPSARCASDAVTEILGRRDDELVDSEFSEPINLPLSLIYVEDIEGNELVWKVSVDVQ
ncbi:hypothetical protein LXA43DRAFT_1103916 [Ganoderma leucocontextum]|nr:hypothetical protein LXA43DRAFT_1103916 [Ganoderma leucocontextum]